MRNHTFKKRIVIVFSLVLILSVLSGCGGQALSSDFDEADVKADAEQVVALVNARDAEGLRAICTVTMRQALTDDVLDQVFATVDEGGAFEAISKFTTGGMTDKSSGEEFAVVIANAKYEIKSFTYTITFTKQKKVAGLYLK